MNWPWIQQVFEALGGAAMTFYIIGVCVARGGKIEMLESKLRNKDREIELLQQLLENTVKEEDDEQ